MIIVVLNGIPTASSYLWNIDLRRPCLSNHVANWNTLHQVKIDRRANAKTTVFKN